MKAGMDSDSLPRCAVVIATHRRADLLVQRSLPSVARQTIAPARVVVLDDGGFLQSSTRRGLQTVVGESPIEILDLSPASGAAAAWNVGLRHLAETGFAGFVAILDDDDTWDADHLEANLQAAVDQGANVVVSGLRMKLEGVLVPRPLPGRLEARQFLVGNPGWQGSNTFVDLELLLRVGGFREGLVSCNDRDLAIRLLRHETTRVAYTERWTATWFVGASGTLSSRGSTVKATGLGMFWRLYGAGMSEEETLGFFERADRLFGVSREWIEQLAHRVDASALRGIHGETIK
jgi:hypothetical protein